MQLSHLRRGYPPVVRVKDKDGKVHELKKNPAEGVFEVLDLATMETRNAFAMSDYEALLAKMEVHNVDPYPTMELSQLRKGYPPAVYVRDANGNVHALRKSPAERVFEILDLETLKKRNVFSANDYSNLRKQYEQELQQLQQGDDPAVRFVKSEEEALLLTADDEEYAYEVHSTPFLFYDRQHQDDDDDDYDDDDVDDEHAHPEQKGASREKKRKARKRKRRQQKSSNKTRKAAVMSDSHPRLNKLHSVMVYCNLVRHKAIGGTQAPLLRIVYVGPRLIPGDVLHLKYETLQYSRLSQYNFSHIELELFDTDGNPIEFSPLVNHPTVAVLHLKQV
jgi:hypothetical protein